MPCTHVTLPGGYRAIVCTSRSRKPLPKCACGKPGRLLCDWKVGSGKTCDKPICMDCTTSPAKDKDLCPEHAEALKHWRPRGV